MHRAVKGIIIIVILLALLYREPLVAAEGEASRGLSRAVRAPFAAVGALFGGSGANKELAALRRENERLRAQVAELRNQPKAAEVAGRPSIEARVYSTYPWNNEDLLTVRAGSRDGIRVGMAVVTADHFLLGQVIEVMEYTSRVRTIFDSRFEFAVKIGEQGSDALLTGGRVPRLTLIEKKAAVASGEAVASAGVGFPLGTAAGAVRAVRRSPTANFQEADLAVPYAAGDLDTVYVLP